MTELIKSIILASRWNYNRNSFFYSSIIKHVHVFKGVIWQVQQNVFKCFIIPVPQFSYIYTSLFILIKQKNSASSFE